ncbi:hypothetical protein FKP32DRAFT_1754691 [Trametes sanguinea]|nr:hypothetical protein FKP32DRAFT_1754691 [Trametes sanguinea]
MISLPRLRVFSVSGSFQFVTALFACLLLPSDIPSFEVNFVHLYLQANAAARAFPAHFHPILKRMTQVDASTWLLAGDRMKLVFSSPHQPWPRTVQDSLSISLASSSFIHPCEMAHILPLVPITSLVLRLQAGGHYGGTYYQREWAALFDAYRSLRHLQVTLYDTSQRGADSLLNMLKTLSMVRPRARDVDACALLRCPNLRRLSIHAPLPDARNSREVLHTLLDVVGWRVKSRAPITSLDLHFWHGSGAPLEPKHRELLTQIREVVGNVHCRFGFSLACRACR